MYKVCGNAHIDKYTAVQILRLGIQVSLNITPVVSCTFLSFLIRACVVCTAVRVFILLAIYTCFSMYIDFVLVSV